MGDNSSEKAQVLITVPCHQFLLNISLKNHSHSLSVVAYSFQHPVNLHTSTFCFVHHALTFINAYDLIITLHMSNTQIQDACRQR